jgi:hypothetical protein
MGPIHNAGSVMTAGPHPLGLACVGGVGEGSLVWSCSDAKKVICEIKGYDPGGVADRG